MGHRRLASLVMGQEPVIANMNPATSGKPNTRASGYHLKALAEIRNSLLPFANGGASSNDNYSSAASTISTISTTSGVSSASGLSSNSNGLDKDLSQIISMGYSEVSFCSIYTIVFGKEVSRFGVIIVERMFIVLHFVNVRISRYETIWALQRVILIRFCQFSCLQKCKYKFLFQDEPVFIFFSM